MSSQRMRDIQKARSAVDAEKAYLLERLRVLASLLEKQKEMEDAFDRQVDAVRRGDANPSAAAQLKASGGFSVSGGGDRALVAEIELLRIPVERHGLLVREVKDDVGVQERRVKAAEEELKRAEQRMKGGAR